MSTQTNKQISENNSGKKESIPNHQVSGDVAVDENVVKCDTEHSMTLLYQFFCWCSGARLYILKQCPTDYNKFFGIGIIIFLTGLMASFSGGYALYTIFENAGLAIFFGVFWGAVIFFLDWYLVSSLKKEKKIGKELTAALPRLILAVFLAIVISKPLELKLFEKEINRQIALEKTKNSIEYNRLVNEEFEEIDRLKKENDKYLKEIKAKQGQRGVLFNMMITEAEGTSGTGRQGKGPVYEEKKYEFEKADIELNELKELYFPIIKENNQTIKELKEKKMAGVSAGKIVNKDADGFLARLEAFGILSEENETISWSAFFILILFVLIESSPMLVKLISSAGPYDEYLKAEEYARFVDSKRKMVKYKYNAQNEINVAAEAEKLRLESGVEISREFIKNITKAQHDLNQAVVEKWKEEERRKIEEKFAEYVETIERVSKQGFKPKTT